MARREQRVSGREAMIRFEFRRHCGASGGKVAQMIHLKERGEGEAGNRPRSKPMHVHKKRNNKRVE